MRRQLRHFVITALVFCVCLPLASQTPTATLVGRITDSTGAGVPEAAIQIQNEATNELRQLKAGGSGDFTVPNLAPGAYTVLVDKEGFRRHQEKGLALQVGQVARLDVRLEVGALSESVEVTAEAPVLNTDSAVRGDVVAKQEILEMPLDGRNVADLAYMVPEVADATDTGTAGSGMAINGARNDNTNLVVDGVTSNDARSGGFAVSIPLDAVQEFKMQTSGYSAEFGRLAGGVMTVALRGGGNTPHGALYEFLRNDKMDARNFFAVGKDKLRRNQFGASFDGPVFLPKLYNGRDRTFFMFTWESYRQEIGSSRLARVATEMERAGDFSQSLDAAGKPVLVRDPLARGNCTAADRSACFPNNRIPADRISAISNKIIPYFPLPNRPGQVNNRLANANLSQKWDSFAAKFDHRLSSKDALTARWLRRNTSNRNPFGGSDLGVFGNIMPANDGLVGLTWTRTFSPTLINELRASYTRTATRGSFEGAGRDYAGELGIIGTTREPGMMGFPRINVRDLTVLSAPNAQPFTPTANTYNYADTFTWVKGTHLLKFGGDAVRNQIFQPFITDLRGTFTFQGRWTNVPFADFLLGMPETATRLLAPAWNYFFSTSYGAFVQDDFKARPDLTLSLGLRYELSKPLVDKYDRLASYVPHLGKVVVADKRGAPNFDADIAAAGLTNYVGLAKDYGLPRALTYAQKTNFAPRFGFAWRPFGGSRTVLRGGYGIFYAGSANNSLRNNLGNVYPFTVSQTFRRNQNDPNALTFSNPYPEGKAAGQSVTNANGYELDAPAQYLQSWSFTAEREIGKGSAIELSYSASKGTHLGKRYDINQPLRSAETRLPNGGFARPYPGYATVNYYSFGSDSSYNAAIVSVRKRFANGFFYRASYVFSKSIDLASELAGSSSGGYAGAQDSRNLSLERGRSDWDSRHVFTMNFTYEMPKGSGRLLRGWQLAGSGKMRSGQPFTVRVSNANLDQGEANRPDRIANGRLSNPTPERWFDASAFVPVPLGAYRFGNSGRNILDGPGQVNLNASLSRRFRLFERHTLQLRVESFNLTNHTNFYRMPATAVDSPGVGTITSALAARTMQLALRYQF